MKEGTPLPNPLEEFQESDCFACGKNHPHGLKLKLMKGDDHVFCRFSADQEFSGFWGILHGGIQSTILDEVMWWAAFDSRGLMCVTQTMEVEYKLPVHTGAEILAMARVRAEKESSIDVVGELRIGERVVTRANGCYVIPPERVMARALGVKVDEMPEKLRPYLKK